MSKNEKEYITWEVEKKGHRARWQLYDIEKQQEMVDELENDSAQSDKMAMLVFLLFILVLCSLATACLFTGLAFSMARNLGYPSIEFVGRDLVVIFQWAFGWSFGMNVLIVAVHARIGRLIANYDKLG